MERPEPGFRAFWTLAVRTQWRQLHKRAPHSAVTVHDTAPIHAVYLGKVDRLPSRVRAVLDFLVANVSVDSRLGRRRVAITS